MWSYPFQGLLFFFSRPRLWLYSLFASLFSFLLTAYACYKTVAFFWPKSSLSFGPYLWKGLQAMGWGAFALALMVVVLFPFIFNWFFTKGLKNYVFLEKKGGSLEIFFSSFFIFFKTLRWRILWPLFLLVSIFTIPFLTIPLSFLAVNHLAVIEGVDLILSLFKVSPKKRVHFLKTHGTECFIFALSGALLLFLLSLTLLGWLIWIPAIYSGVFLWLQKSYIVE